jgi:hypothetical protein
VFASSQAVLIGVSFASLNLSTYFIDLTAPITAGFVFFSLARVYAYAEVALAERRVWLKLVGEAEGWQRTLVSVLLLEGSESGETKIITALKRRLNARKEGFTIESFPNKPAGIGRAYGDLMLIYYVDSDIVADYPQDEGPSNEILALIKEEAAAVCGLSPGALFVGSCVGAMPYGDEKGRIEAWRKLVTHAIHAMHDPGGGGVFTDLKQKEI